MSGDVTQYINLLPIQSRAQPNFVAALTALLQPLVDIKASVDSITLKYDIDVAEGAQLDTVGQWVGQSRFVEIPLVGVYFSLDIAEVGLDQGIWIGADDPNTELDALPDSYYRILLKAKIGSNYWDGTKDEANRIWDTLFLNQGIKVITIDNDDMSMDMGLITDNPLPAVTRALFQGGYLTLKPAGVRINNYFINSALSAPFFGLDVENDVMKGLDEGSWAESITARLGIDFVLGFSKLGF
jgi:hypothetical protein